MDSTTAIPLDTKNDLFIGQIALCDAADGLTGCRRTSFLTYVVEVNPIFITSDDPVQNFVLALIFEQISAGTNTSVLICLSQLMWHPMIELVRQVYAMHSMTNGHCTNV